MEIASKIPAFSASLCNFSQQLKHRLLRFLEIILGGLRAQPFPAIEGKGLIMVRVNPGPVSRSFNELNNR